MLSELLQRAGVRSDPWGDVHVDVSAIACDSRRVRPGGAFLALKALEVDGHPHIPRALEAGARVIFAETDPPPSLPADRTWVRVEGTAGLLGPLVSTLLDHPSRDLDVLAVTGTNGKTTVCWLLEHILASAGKRPGVIGTVEVRYAERRIETPFTTPLADLMQELLAQMRDAGCTHAVCEASSHGLVQGRLAGTRITVGGYTNLTRDHIDYHGSMEEYGAAKALLFDGVAERACFCIDDPHGAALAEAFGGEKITASLHDPRADLFLDDVELSISGSRGRIGDAELFTPLVGEFNVENALVALGMAELAGIPREEILGALASATAAPGRLERVRGPKRVLVDYAHTPSALHSVLSALSPLVEGQLICVFGAGGDRDKGKRPLMGRAVAAHADIPVITSDNPRSEQPMLIIEDIAAGFPPGKERVIVEDRREAIARALELAGPEDLVLIAGKGHEDYQIIGAERLPFDDREIARELMEAMA